ncbi:MAG: gliding motility-associated C-terminal domain-containing protein, partial [Bacteroidales bacterium]|nr:gliding motility-associated C-terminal domain-containing protein [Bacteroidales bacterium]
ANAGDYIITVSDIPGECPETSNTTAVIVGGIPAMPVVISQNINGSTQDVCATSIVSYSVSSPVAGSDYTWSVSGGGNIQASGTPDMIDIDWFAPSGTFDLTVSETNSAGCTGEPYLLTINIIPNTFPSVSISADNESVCPGTPVQFTAIPADAGTTPVYRWIINGTDAGVSTADFLLDSPADNDLVTCEVTSSDLCAAPATVTSNPVELTVFAAPVVNIPAEDPICAGTPTLLDPGSSFSSYLWSDGSTASTITVEEEGIYWVLVTDVNGCAGSDTVRVEPCETVPLIFVPNAFTPNGDSRNDRFFMVCSNPAIISQFEMNIYNRWGQVIYTGNNIGEGWDGTMNGKPCPMDIYSYVITYTIAEPEITSKQTAGTVTLVR